MIAILGYISGKADGLRSPKKDVNRKVNKRFNLSTESLPAHVLLETTTRDHFAFLFSEREVDCLLRAFPDSVAIRPNFFLD